MTDLSDERLAELIDINSKYPPQHFPALAELLSALRELQSLRAKVGTHVLVPREPSWNMLAAGVNAPSTNTHTGTMKESWDAMLAVTEKEAGNQPEIATPSEVRDMDRIERGLLRATFDRLGVAECYLRQLLECDNYDHLKRSQADLRRRVQGFLAESAMLRAVEGGGDA